MAGLLLALLLSSVAAAFIRKIRSEQLEIRQKLADSQRLVSRLQDAETRYRNRIHTLRRSVRNTESALEAFRSEYLYVFRSGFRRLGTLFEARYYAKSERSFCQRVGEVLKEIDGDPEGQKLLVAFIEGRLDRPVAGLREDLPDLKDEDIRLFMYLVIGFDASLISLLMGINSLSTVYSRKKRLVGKIRKLPPAKARRYLVLME